MTLSGKKSKIDAFKTRYRSFATRVTQLKMHYFSGGGFESLIPSQLLKKEKCIYLIISISKQCMESCQFSFTYTVISGLLVYVDSSKRQNLELCHCSANKRYVPLSQSYYIYIIYIYILLCLTGRRCVRCRTLASPLHGHQVLGFTALPSQTSKW